MGQHYLDIKYETSVRAYQRSSRQKSTLAYTIAFFSVCLSQLIFLALSLVQLNRNRCKLMFPLHTIQNRVEIICNYVEICIFFSKIYTELNTSSVTNYILGANLFQAIEDCSMVVYLYLLDLCFLLYVLVYSAIKMSVKAVLF